MPPASVDDWFSIQINSRTAVMNKETFLRGASGMTSMLLFVSLCALALVEKSLNGKYALWHQSRYVPKRD
jgi:hypothetical protein